MIELIIPSVELREPLDTGLNFIQIESPKLFRQLYLYCDEEIFLVENGKDIKRETIKNILEIDLNEKKNITSLYKEILRHMRLNHQDEYIKSLNSLTNLIYDVQTELVNSEIEISEKIDEEKILQALNVGYKSSDDFVYDLINYLKIKSYNSNISFFLTFNLNLCLTSEEFGLLNKEMKKLMIYFIDVNSKLVDNGDTKNIIIDQDYCII